MGERTRKVGVQCADIFQDSSSCEGSHYGERRLIRFGYKCQ